MYSKVICIAAFAFLSSGCSESDECKNFPEQLRGSDIAIYNLKDVSGDKKYFDEISSKIVRCYKKRDFFVDDFEISLKNIKKYDDSRYLLSYEVIGISDIFIVFVIDKNGNIFEALEASSQ